MKHIYHDGGAADAGYKTGQDCVCRSIVIATELPYGDVYDRLAEGMAKTRKTRGSRLAGQRSARNGIYTGRKWFKDYMRELGFIWTPTMLVGQGCKVHLTDGELPMGRLVVSVSRHFTAVIDGAIYDTHDPSRGGTRCVYGYWELAQ